MSWFLTKKNHNFNPSNFTKLNINNYFYVVFEFNNFSNVIQFRKIFFPLYLIHSYQQYATPHFRSWICYSFCGAQECLYGDIQLIYQYKIIYCLLIKTDSIHFAGFTRQTSNSKLAIALVAIIGTATLLSVYYLWRWISRRYGDIFHLSFLFTYAWCAYSTLST